MKRRRFVTQATAGVVTGATVSACAQSANQRPAGGALPNIRWRMATSWPPSLDILFGGTKTLAEAVKTMTEGRFLITPYAAGELVPGLQVLDAVQAGTVECGHTAAYYYIGKNPALAFATTIPFGLTAPQQNAWLYNGGGIDLIRKVYADFGVTYFPAGNTGAQMGGWFKREVRSLQDLAGLKMRIPGLGGQVMAKLGVNVQVLPGSELFLALDRGAVDAAEWVGPHDDEILGLNRAAKFYYYPGWWEPGPTLDLLINQKAWETLPAEYQTALEVAATALNLRIGAQYNAQDQAALARLTQGGTRLIAYSPDILKAAERVTQELLAESSAQESTFRQIYDNWGTFRRQIYNWNRVNEFSLMSFLYR